MPYELQDLPGSTAAFLEDTRAPGILISPEFKTTFLILGGAPTMTVMLDSVYGGQSFPIKEEQGFYGIFVPDVRLAINEASRFRPGRFRSPPLSVLRFSDDVVAIVGWTKLGLFRRQLLVPWAGKPQPGDRPWVGYATWQLFGHGIDGEVLLHSQGV